MEHPTAGRRRRHKSPPTLHAPIALPIPRLDDHLDTENGPSDEEGKKEAKRQRSASSRLPYEYDQMMRITQVGSGKTKGFEDGTDLVYHDAAEDPNVLEVDEHTHETVLSHGGCGSSSLRECIELLNNPQRKSPATCHSGANMENRSGPRQLFLTCRRLMAVNSLLAKITLLKKPVFWTHLTTLRGSSELISITVTVSLFF